MHPSHMSLPLPPPRHHTFQLRMNLAMLVSGMPSASGTQVGGGPSMLASQPLYVVSYSFLCSSKGRSGLSTFLLTKRHSCGGPRAGRVGARVLSNCTAAPITGTSQSLETNGHCVSRASGPPTRSDLACGCTRRVPSPNRKAAGRPRPLPLPQLPETQPASPAHPGSWPNPGLPAGAQVHLRPPRPRAVGAAQCRHLVPSSCTPRDHQKSVPGVPLSPSCLTTVGPATNSLQGSL